MPQLATANQDLVQETLLGEALEHSDVGAIVLDEHGQYIAANRMACTLSGYSREELLAGGAETLSVNPDGMRETLDRMARGQLRFGTGTLLRKDGSTTACDYRVGATRSGGLPFHILLFWESPEDS